MAIVIRSGLRVLVEGVRAYFASYGVTAAVSAGFRARYRQDNQGPGRANRVVIMPGDFKSGAGGKLVPPRSPGYREVYDTQDPPRPAGSARAIADWDRTLVISCWSFDQENPNDDFLQQCNAEELVEWTKRAVDSVGLANLEWGAVSWAPPTERQYGAEALLSLTVIQPLFDPPYERAFPEAAVVNKSPQE